MPPPRSDPRALEALARAHLDPRLARVRPSGLPTRRLLEIQRELQPLAVDWLRSPSCHPAVMGYGYGVRWEGGQPGGEPVFQVFARQAIDLGAHGPAALFPPEFRQIVALAVTRAPDAPPGDGEGTVAVEAFEPVVPLMGPGADAASLRQRRRTLVGGCSFGHPSVTAGTLALRVFEDARGAAGGRALALSNCHVLAADPSRPRLGDPVLHPATADLGDARRDVVGRVVDCEPLRPGLAVPNRMDAAIAEMTDPAALEPGVAGVGEVPFWRPIDDLPVGSVVAKAGRTTGVTFGVLRAVGVTYKVDYALGAPLLFTGQVLTSHLAMGGDSGAALLALGEAPSVVGLILGGSRDVTLATPIDDVQRRFDVLAAPARWPARRAVD